MKISRASAFVFGALITTPPAFAEESCDQLAARIQPAIERTAVDPVELLNLIDREVSASPACACEIVKAAILGTDCDDSIVGYIVETAVRAAPEQMRIISQCAIATAPGSLVRVQEVMSRLDPAAGERKAGAKDAKSAKDAKDAKGLEVKPAVIPNPLDVLVVGIPPVPPVINLPPSTATDFAYWTYAPPAAAGE